MAFIQDTDEDLLNENQGRRLAAEGLITLFVTTRRGSLMRSVRALLITPKGALLATNARMSACYFGSDQ